MSATFSTPDKPVPPKKRDQSKRRAGYQPKFSLNGRPTKRTPKLEEALLAAVSSGAPYRVACSACGISSDTFTEWRRKDPVFARQVEIAAGKAALRLLKKIEANADQNFSAAAWILERRFPSDFSRPEVQFNIQQNNTVQNNLVLTISESEAAEIEAEAEPIRATTRELFERYRPGTVGNRDNHGGWREPVREIEVESVVVEQLPIEHKPGEAGSPAFWVQFTDDPGRLVKKATASFVVRTIVLETVGHCPRIEFDSDSVRVSDCLSAIERIVGIGSCAGWQRLLAKAGIKS